MCRPPLAPVKEADSWSSAVSGWIGMPRKEEREGYAKVLELYCLHILPRLEDWDYAEDFLQYERELAPDTRKVSGPEHFIESGFVRA